MFVNFFQELKSAGVPVTLREYLTLMEAMQADLASRRVEDFYYLSRAALVKDERNLDKFDRVFGHVFKGLEMLGDAVAGRDPGRVAEEARREISHRGREEADRGHGRAREAFGDAEEAAGRAEGPSPRRLEMDRHRRHVALWRLRLQSGRRAHRPGREPQFPRRQGVGQTRVQGPRRRGRTRHPQHQGGAAPPAQIRPHRRARGARSRRHHQGHRAQGLSRHPDAARSGTTR